MPCEEDTCDPSAVLDDVYVVGFFSIEGSRSSRNSSLGEGAVVLGVEDPGLVKTIVGA